MITEETGGSSAPAEVAAPDVKKLREYYKRYKVGMVKWEQIPGSYQMLLKKYYKCGSGVV
jgi:hypothetical protein